MAYQQCQCDEIGDKIWQLGRFKLMFSILQLVGAPGKPLS